MLNKSSQLHARIDTCSKVILALRLMPCVMAMIRLAVIALHVKHPQVISSMEENASKLMAIATVNLELTSAMAFASPSARPVICSIQTMAIARPALETLSTRELLADVYTIKSALTLKDSSRDKTVHVAQLTSNALLGFLMALALNAHQIMSLILEAYAVLP